MEDLDLESGSFLHGRIGTKKGLILRKTSTYR